jgi:predicted AlkP superfamily phosphohydrolase/phosphomutase
MSRFLLIGLDGAEPSLVESWMAERRLPRLALLRDSGSYLHLASTIPPATFPAWTTCVTGVNPGRHGIFDFTEMVPGEYALRFVNATARKSPALWNVLSQAGKRVAVIGVPATYPPEVVNGIMVSGFDSPVCTAVDRSFVYPESLYPEVRDWRFADFQETHIGPGWHQEALPKLLEGIAVKEGIAAKLLARDPWDFFMVVFGESDTVAHHFWLFHDPHSPRHQAGFEDAIRRVYERLDAAVGRLIETAGEGVTVGIVSDHGFGGAGTGVVHLNNWLAEQGYLRFTGGGGSLLKTLALNLVPERCRGSLFRRFRALAEHAEGASRFSDIDWERTRAWSEELNYFPSIRVNLKGRDPQGQVDPGEYDSLCTELCRRLETWDPVKKAWRRDEIYHGACVDRAPDIVLELGLEEGYSYSCLRGRGGPAFRRIGPDEHLGAKEHGMNGAHRPTGVLFLSERTVAGAACIEDVAPTVLAALGVAAPPMDGTSLFTSPGFPADTVPYSPFAAPYSPQQERAVEERLRALGYLE